MLPLMGGNMCDVVFPWWYSGLLGRRMGDVATAPMVVSDVVPRNSCPGV